MVLDGAPGSVRALRPGRGDACLPGATGDSVPVHPVRELRGEDRNQNQVVSPSTGGQEMKRCPA
jgi:hypothetical protein